MTIAWLTPIALAGIGLVALPIAIHLFVRQHARRVVFPSLRFLRETQLASFRVRRIEDAWLLLVRSAIITLAAMALAGPLIQTASRQAESAHRTSRAIVEVGAVADDVVTRLRGDAFRSAVLHRDHVADAIADAVRWLDAQPASAREIVIAGPLHRGDLDDADLTGVPRDIGVRFDQLQTVTPSELAWPILASRDGALVRIDRKVQLTTDATRIVGDVAAVPVAADLIRVIGKDQRIADAALRAALTMGVPWRDFTSRVQITLPDDTPVAAAADVVRQELRRRSPPEAIDPVQIPAAQLSEWTRQPGAPSSTAPPSDEGDRRWLWALVLMLLAVESWMRRRASDEVVIEEQRVA